MDGQTNTDGWTDGQIDRWMDKTNTPMDGQMDKLTDIWMDRQKKTLINRWVDGWTN